MAIKQGKLPGVVPTEIDEINTTFETYLDARQSHGESTVALVDAKDALLRLLKKHGRAFYGHAGFTAEIVAEETIKVKRNKEDDGAAE